jgi:ATP-dependent protease ClpP protease subunit
MRFLLMFLMLTGLAKAEINLTATNSYTIYGPIRDESINEAIKAVSKPSVEYLVIASPGGEVEAGKRFISFMKTKKNLKCVAVFAASMAFSIFQHCKDRLVVSNGTLMQHEMIIALGPLPLSQFIAMLKGLLIDSQLLYRYEARRLKMSFKDYLAMVKDNLWIFSGEAAVTKRAADKVVSVTCSEELLVKEGSLEVNTPFGPMNFAYPLCPLIR